MRIYRMSLEIERPRTYNVIENPYVNQFSQKVAQSPKFKIHKQYHDIQKIDLNEAITYLSQNFNGFQDGLTYHLKDMSTRRTTFNSPNYNIMGYFPNQTHINEALSMIHNRRDVEQKTKNKIFSCYYSVMDANPDDFVNIIYKKNEDGTYSSI